MPAKPAYFVLSRPPAEKGLAQQIPEVLSGERAYSEDVYKRQYDERVYSFVRREVTAGRQVYIICPAVEESEESELKSAVEYQSFLQDVVFPDLKVGLLHGKMRPEQKDEVMEAFASGDIPILVSTTVVEVGVNVPNATPVSYKHLDVYKRQLYDHDEPYGYHGDGALLLT